MKGVNPDIVIPSVQKLELQDKIQRSVLILQARQEEVPVEGPFCLNPGDPDLW